MTLTYRAFRMTEVDDGRSVPQIGPRGTASTSGSDGALPSKCSTPTDLVATAGRDLTLDFCRLLDCDKCFANLWFPSLIEIGDRFGRRFCIAHSSWFGVCPRGLTLLANGSRPGLPLLNC